MTRNQGKRAWHVRALYALLPNAGWDAIKFLVWVGASGTITVMYRRLVSVRGLPHDSLIDVSIFISCLILFALASILARKSRRAELKTDTTTEQSREPQIESQSSNSAIGADLPNDFDLRSHEKFPGRWRQIALALGVGIILGLIFAAILARFDLFFKPVHSYLPSVKDENTVSMVGSGTVFRYLARSNFFVNLNEGGKNVPVLEGPTETAASIFAGSPDQSRILIMASKQLNASDLKYEGQPGAIYEVYLGADTFEVLFAIGALRKEQPSQTDNFLLNVKELRFTDLVKQWRNDRYDIYAGALGSGTRKLWEGLFGDHETVWPSSINIWDIRTDRILDWPSDSNPRIYLGSGILVLDDYNTLKSKSIPANRIIVLDNSGRRVKRGLYLYGWIDNRKPNVGNSGYSLPNPIAPILKDMFRSLEDREPLRKQLLEAGQMTQTEADEEIAKLNKCFESQRVYFHLRRDEPRPEGWISKYPATHDNIYRAPSCELP